MGDFEATCDCPMQLSQQEIIEFPIVLMNGTTNEMVSEFHSFCKPSINPKLTKFCTQLTGITQKQVDIAPPLSVVLSQVDTWLKETNGLEEDEIVFITCGNW